MLSKFIGGRSWHFLLHSFIPRSYLLFFLPEALWCCSLRPIILFCQDHVQFLPFIVGVLSKLYHSFPFSILFQPECYVYHSSSSRSLHPSAFILPSSYSLPSISNRSVAVIDLYRSLCISFYRSVCMYFLSIAILFFCLSTYKVLVMFLVTFSNGVISTSFIVVAFFISFCSTS